MDGWGGEASGDILIIGYGNDLRRDDGLGRRAAERIAEWRHPALRALSVHQLAPELAEPLSRARAAVFIDAYPAAEGEGVRVVPLTSTGSDPRVGEAGQEAVAVPLASRLGHTGGPQELLGLAASLYGRAPQAWWVLAPGVDFAFGDGLSPSAEVELCEALESVRRLCDDATE